MSDDRPRIPPCPACGALPAKVVRLADDPVVWFLCGVCGHKWLSALDEPPPTKR